MRVTCIIMHKYLVLEYWIRLYIDTLNIIKNQSFRSPRGSGLGAPITSLVELTMLMTFIWTSLWLGGGITTDDCFELPFLLFLLLTTLADSWLVEGLTAGLVAGFLLGFMGSGLLRVLASLTSTAGSTSGGVWHLLFNRVHSWNSRKVILLTKHTFVQHFWCWSGFALTPTSPGNNINYTSFKQLIVNPRSLSALINLFGINSINKK